MPKVVMLTTLAPTTAQRLVEVAPPGYEVEVHPAKLPVEAQRDAVVPTPIFSILFSLSPDNAVLAGAKRLKRSSWSARASTRSTSTCAAAWGFRSPTTAGPTRWMWRNTR